MEKKVHKNFHNSQFDLHTAVIKTHTTTYLMLKRDGCFTLPLRGPPREHRSNLSHYQIAEFMRGKKHTEHEQSFYSKCKIVFTHSAYTDRPLVQPQTIYIVFTLDGRRSTLLVVKFSKNRPSLIIQRFNLK